MQVLQKRTGHAFFQALSFFLTFSFILPTHQVYAAQVKAKKTLFLIQDAHSIPQVQNEIRQIILRLQKKYPIEFVATEGAASGLDAQIFRSFPDRTVLYAMIQNYLERGEMTGVTAVAIQGKGRGVYFGMENAKLYYEGLRLYQEAIEKESGWRQGWEARRHIIEAEKQKIFSRELLRIEEWIKSFDQDSTKAAEFLIKLNWQRELNRDSLMELKVYLERTKQAFLRTPAEIELNAKSEEIDLMGKLISLQLNREGWEKISNHDLGYREAVAFYRNAVDRESAMFPKLKNEFKTKQIGIVVAGGFHTAGFKKYCAEQNWNCEVITPSIDAIRQNSFYEQHMKGQFSWISKSEIEGEHINLRTSFIRAFTAELLERVDIPKAVTLKNWRNNLILNSALEDHLEKISHGFAEIQSAATQPSMIPSLITGALSSDRPPISLLKGGIGGRSELRGDHSFKSPEQLWREEMRREFRERRDIIWDEGGPFYDLEGKMQRYSALTDEFMQRIYAEVHSKFPEVEMALAAMGSYGRREMVLPSDADGRIIIRRKPDALFDNGELLEKARKLAQKAPGTLTAEEENVVARYQEDVELHAAITFINQSTIDIVGTGWIPQMVSDEIPMELTKPETSEMNEEGGDRLIYVTELLDARFIVGEKAIYDDRIGELSRQLEEKAEGLTKALIKVWSDRYHQADLLEGLFDVEPNLKEGIQGLRAYHFARWIAQAYTGERREPFEELMRRGQLTGVEYRCAKDAYEKILRIRNAKAQLKEDKRSDSLLDIESQSEVAAYLNYAGDPATGETPEQELMSEYYEASRIVFLFSAKVIRRILETSNAPHETDTQPTAIEGVSSANRNGLLFTFSKGLHEVNPGNPERFLIISNADGANSIGTMEPEKIMPIFLLAAEGNYHLSGHLRDRIENSVPRLKEVMREPEFRRKVHQQMKRLFESPVPISRVLIGMQLLGVLQAVLPEFEAIHARAQWDIHHRYPADIHTLKAVEYFDQIVFGETQSSIFAEDYNQENFNKIVEWMKQQNRFSTLRLTLLLEPLHEHHKEAERQLAKNLELESEWKNIEWLHKHQESLTNLLRRRGLTRASHFRDFLDKVIKNDYSRWVNLILLTLVDVQLLRPERLWLFEHELELALGLTEEQFENPSQTATWIQQQEERRARELGRTFGRLRGDGKINISVQPFSDVPQQTATAEVFIHYQETDGPGRLAKIAGVIAANSLNVLTAKLSIDSQDGLGILDRFVVSHPNFTQYSDIEGEWRRISDDLRTDLADHLVQGKPMTEIFESHGRRYAASKVPPKLKIDTNISFRSSQAGFTWLEIKTADAQPEDQPILLHLIAGILAGEGINIETQSTIDTVGHSNFLGRMAIDTFAVSYNGQPLDRKKRNAVRNKLLQTLNQKNLSEAEIYNAFGDFSNQIRRSELREINAPLYTQLDSKKYLDELKLLRRPARDRVPKLSVGIYASMLKKPITGRLIQLLAKHTELSEIILIGRPSVKVTFPRNVRTRRIREKDLQQNLILKNDQHGLPIATNKWANQLNWADLNIPVFVDMVGVDDPLVQYYADRLQAAVLIELGRLMSGEQKALSAEEIREELMRRLPQFSDYSNIIAVISGSGLSISGKVIRDYLAAHATRTSA